MVRHMKRIGTCTLAAALLLAGTGCGSGSSLAQRDPAGYRACQDMVEGIDPDTPNEERMDDILIEEGKDAKQSTTPAIRAAASPLIPVDEQSQLDDSDNTLADDYLVDAQALAKACRDNGIHVGPLPSPATS
jgi:hypothetical protein